MPDLKTLDYSVLCGVARVVNIVSKSSSKWIWRPDDGSPNYGWVFTDVTSLKKPIFCMVTIGLWEGPQKILKKIQRQLSKLKLGEE